MGLYSSGFIFERGVAFGKTANINLNPLQVQKYWKVFRNFMQHFNARISKSNSSRIELQKHSCFPLKMPSKYLIYTREMRTGHMRKTY